jgi:DNA-binding Xre family transcriptional regulator
MPLAVLTGDIIGSSKLKDGLERALLAQKLKECLAYVAKTKTNMEITRGDSFQVIIGDCKDALFAAIYIRCFLKTILKPGLEIRKTTPDSAKRPGRNVFVNKAGEEVTDGVLITDARISIGIGEINYKAKKLSESDGTAFQNSGRGFDMLSKDSNLSITTDSSNVTQKTLELICEYVDHIIKGWSFNQAEAVLALLNSENFEVKQSELAKKIGITQPSLSQRINSANWELIKKSIRISGELLA